jgi:hypothetical protein
VNSGFLSGRVSFWLGVCNGTVRQRPTQFPITLIFHSLPDKFDDPEKPGDGLLVRDGLLFDVIATPEIAFMGNERIRVVEKTVTQK